MIELDIIEGSVYTATMQALKLELEAFVRGEFLRQQQLEFCREQDLMEKVDQWFSLREIDRRSIPLRCEVCGTSVLVRGPESDPGLRYATQHALFCALRSLTCPECPGYLESSTMTETHCEIVLEVTRDTARCQPQRMFNGLNMIYCF